MSSSTSSSPCAPRVPTAISVLPVCPLLGLSAGFVVNPCCCLAPGITRCNNTLWSPWTLPRNEECTERWQVCISCCTILHYSVLYPSDPTAGSKAGLAAPSSCWVSLALPGWLWRLELCGVNREHELCRGAMCAGEGSFHRIFSVSNGISLTWGSVISRK